VTPNSNLLGTVSYTGTAKGAVNVGNYVLTPQGLYSNQQGYIITYNSGELTINQLPSVAWVGGATGNWSTASNWAHGAIPDFANVATVTIPAGVTVTYDGGVPGTTTLSTLVDHGNFVMAAGDLSTTGNVTTGGFQQSGGMLNVGGALTIQSASTSGVELGDITAHTLAITSTAGGITQIASTALDVTGAATLTADNGVSGAGDVKYGITLADTGNNFAAEVTSNGSNVDLADGTGGIILGNTTAAGTLTVDSLGGNVVEVAGKTINVKGASTLIADNGVSGTGDVRYAVTLANATNSFAGSVSATGAAITLADATALTAKLSSKGAVKLTAAGAMNVSGTIGTSLATVTTGGTASTTTFGTTTVGTTLNVTSPGAVATAASSTLTVDKKATTTPNANVTVNGVSDVAIPVQ
jgi:trimeric autotransporter adhesin